MPNVLPERADLVLQAGVLVCGVGLVAGAAAWVVLGWPGVEPTMGYAASQPVLWAGLPVLPPGRGRVGLRGLPTAETCMNCHLQLYTTEPMLAPVRNAWATGKTSVETVGKGEKLVPAPNAAPEGEWAILDSAQPLETPRKTVAGAIGGTPGGTLGRDSGLDPRQSDLRRVLTAWPALPSAIRAAMLALVDAAQSGHTMSGPSRLPHPPC
jgi:hypothetical protein